MYDLKPPISVPEPLKITKERQMTARKSSYKNGIKTVQTVQKHIAEPPKMARRARPSDYFPAGYVNN